MGEVYSHLSEEERQVIQIEVGNGASIRGIGAMLGRSPSSISREIKRNTWFPSNENESYRPYRPKRLKAGPWTGRYYIAGPAQRKADRRRSKPRKPYRLSHDRLWAQVAEWLGRGWSPLPVSGRPRVLCVFRQVGVSCLVMYFFRVGAGAVLLDSSLIPSPPIMPQDRARVDDP